MFWCISQNFQNHDFRKIHVFAEPHIACSSLGSVNRDRSCVRFQCQGRVGGEGGICFATTNDEPHCDISSGRHAEYTRDGTRTRNLLLRREAPYPLGHTSKCQFCHHQTFRLKRVEFLRMQLFCCQEFQIQWLQHSAGNMPHAFLYIRIVLIGHRRF